MRKRFISVLLILSVSCIRNPTQMGNPSLSTLNIRKITLIDDNGKFDEERHYTVYSKVIGSKGIVAHNLLLYGVEPNDNWVQQKLFRYSDYSLKAIPKAGMQNPYTLTLYEDGIPFHFKGFQRIDSQNTNLTSIGLLEIVLEKFNLEFEESIEIAFQVYDSSGRLKIYTMELTKIETCFIESQQLIGKNVCRVMFDKHRGANSNSFLLVDHGPLNTSKTGRSIVFN